MNKEVLKSIATSIFDAVKEDVIMNIKMDLDDVVNEKIILEDEEMYLNIVENYNRIIAYYNNEYLMLLIFEYLSNIITEEEDLLVFGSYIDSSMHEVIKALVEKIREIGCPLFISSKYYDEQDQLTNNVASEFDNYVSGKYFVVLAFRDILSHWHLEKGYLHEIECKSCHKQYIEENYFEEYINNHRNFSKFLYHHATTIENLENEHLNNDYPHLL